ncbi:sigma-54 dependent transcriptional regulator [Desulfocurvibacter africanus]|uniref:sigma-54 dependent transcriptional regulator n=1 Tax=Desulfocurvibacter africanus TaxID=873 RepID=UPI002FD9CF6C
MSSRSILFVAQAQFVMALFPRCKEAGFEVGLADTLSGALNFIKKSKPEAVFSRVRFPGYRIENLLAEAAGAMGDFPPVYAFTDAGSAEEANRLMELGAQDYWLEPLAWDKVEAVTACAPRSVQTEVQPQPARPTTSVKKSIDIIGRHPVILRVLALARQVARSKATVLIAGESGTGKEKFARFLHNNSDRSSGPFVAINCAALPEHLLESELFGHEKGAFTGAIGRKLGKFELATGGSILLDEISEMDMGLQAKLLRVLQEQEIDRVGGTETVKVDTRVLATTNRRLDEYVKDGKFRQDLYYRLNVIPLKLPALRERGDDVLLLADFFVNSYCRDYGLPKLGFSADARRWLLEYDWPGNVRELQNLMERAVLLAGTGPIETAHFLLDEDAWPLGEDMAAVCQTAAAGFAADMASVSGGSLAAGGSLTDADTGSILPLAEMERHLILRSLDQTQGNRTQAANLLGISVRTLRNKLNEYRQLGMEIP